MERCPDLSGSVRICPDLSGSVRICPEVWKRVEGKLRGQQWSPQQISVALAMAGDGKVSHETIYQHIYRDKKAEGKLHHHLRHRCKSYRRRGGARESRGRIKDQVMIDERPKVAEERSRIGDWEMDTMIGRPGGKVLATMMEKKSRYSSTDWRRTRRRWKSPEDFLKRSAVTATRWRR